MKRVRDQVSDFPFIELDLILTEENLPGAVGWAVRIFFGVGVSVVFTVQKDLAER